jgi:hypothetical protein
MLLFKIFIKTLAGQLYLKLTKFTRRSSGPKSFLRKFVAGYDFVKDMLAYNWGVIRRCRCCVKKLSAENVPAVLVYGEKDIIEVLSALSFEAPVKMRILRECYEFDKKLGGDLVPVEVSAGSPDKIIVASVVNVEGRTRRLRELGVDAERIVLLDDYARLCE